MRKYEGVGPSVWDDPGGCAHEWGNSVPGENRGGSGTPTDKNNRGEGYGRAEARGRFCLKCPAWLGMLGLEPDPDLFCSHLVEVFRAVKRVLRRDGLLFVNLGSSYAGSGKGPTGWNGIGDQEQRQGFIGDDHPEIDRYFGKRSKNTGGKPPPPGIKAKCDLCIPDRFRLAMVADGWIVRVRAVPWVKRSCMPGSQGDRPTVATEDWIMLSKGARYFWDETAVRRESADSTLLRADIPRKKSPKDHTRAEGDLSGIGRVPVGTVLSDSYASPDGRAMRTTDLYFSSLEGLIADTRRTLAHLERIRERGGLLLDDDGLPLALDITSQGSDLAHYASFPEGVVTPWILGGSPQEVCAECGAPWERVTERHVMPNASRERGRGLALSASIRPGWENGQYDHHSGSIARYESTTLGWAKSCHCPTDARQPAVVLDCFGGSGTTSVVARQLGRHSIYVDASATYAAMAVRRLEGITPTLPTPSSRPLAPTQLALGEGR